MSLVISPRNILESLVAGDAKPISLKPWENGLQKWLFIASFSALIVGTIAAVVSHYNQPTTWLRWVALGFLVSAQIGGMLYQLSIVLPSLKLLKNAEQSLIAPAAESFNDDIDRIVELAHNFGQHHLNYARDRLVLITHQLRQRISFMVGTIDKVGILPSAVAGFFYMKEVLSKPQFASSGVEWIFITLVAFYILASYLVFVSQRLDRLTLILQHAASKKELDSKIAAIGPG